MTVTVNGRLHELAASASVAELVARFTDRESGVAVAVNDAVVPRSQWATTRLAPGDRVEVLTAVQGG
jgi:sulfur carrier protein